MSRVASADLPFSEHRKRRAGIVALIAGLLTVAVIGAVAVLNTGDDHDKVPRSNGIVTGFCTLTSEASPTKGGAGFALKAQCPTGTMRVQPTLSLWMQLIEALTEDKRLVSCTVRGKGELADCRKTDQVANREPAR